MKLNTETRIGAQLPQLTLSDLALWGFGGGRCCFAEHRKRALSSPSSLASVHVGTLISDKNSSEK